MRVRARQAAATTGAGEDPVRYRFVVPEDGRYHLLVSSREASFLSGPRHIYRLRIIPVRPDFRLIVQPPTAGMPSGALIPQGARAYFNVYVWRLDGFDGPIMLRAEGLPEGITASPHTIAAGVRHGALVLRAAEDAPPWTGSIAIKGTATVNGQEVSREARGTTITWPTPQPNQITLSRLDRQIVVAVRGKAPYALNPEKESIAAQAGSKVAIPVKIHRLWPEAKGQIQVVALGLPPNVALTSGNQPVNLPAGKDEGTLPLDVRAAAVPGLCTIVLRSQMVFPYSREPKGKPQNVIAVQPCAITLRILPRELAKFTLTPPTPSIKPGEEIEVIVKTERLHNLEGPIKLQLIVPPPAKGLTAEPVTIPAGTNEAKIKLRADEGLKPGSLANLILRASAEIHEATAIQETKFGVNVVK